MTAKRFYEYQGETLTINQMAAIKGVSRSWMTVLLNEYSVDEAMAYIRKPAGAKIKRPHLYKGKLYSTDELIQLARVKCTKNGMSNRIKKYGVAFSIECDDFLKFKRRAHQNRKPPKQVSIPEHNPEQHYLNNLFESLKATGMNDDDIYNEVKRRLVV